MRLEELVNRNYQKLSDNDKYIWKYIAQHKKECEKLSIDQLASKCHVSRTTISRFTQRLGLKGYAEFKVYLHLDNTRYQNSSSMIEQVYGNYATYMKEVKDKDVTKLLTKIHKAKNLYVYSTGVIQNNVAGELKRSFLEVDRLFFTIHSTNETDAFVDIMDQQDIIIIISYSGENEAMIEFVRKLKTKGVTIVSITSNRDNVLSQMADEALYVSVPDMVNPYGGRYSGLVNYFILIDFLIVKYMELSEHWGKEKL